MGNQLSSSTGNDSMIVVKIFGGLGNQMFQYAAGKSLALESGAVLKMDIEAFKNPLTTETPREWGLPVFKNIEDPIADVGDTTGLLLPIKNGLINRLYKKAVKKIPWLNQRYRVEQTFNYSPVAFTGGRIYLDGYWQSFKYFTSIERELKHLFDLSYLRNEPRLKTLIEEITTTNAVSLHVRRGDYVILSRTNDFIEPCNPRYYYNALQHIIERENEEIKIFVFSDDVEWCKKNILIKQQHAFVKTGIAAHDLYLMSICKHQVISNSTFGWWAAWLNTYAQKIVIAPRKWHKGFKENNEDLLPVDWIIME